MTQALFEALFDEQAQPMWVVDAGTRAFLAVNEAALTLYGYTREEFLALSADQLQENVDDMRRAFADWSNSCSQRVWRHRRKSGEVFDARVTSFSLEFAGRRARLAVIEDLERGRAE
jgi:two-component system, cell cycle sensor histidine kinase and response regulator CckA